MRRRRLASLVEVMWLRDCSPDSQQRQRPFIETPGFPVNHMEHKYHMEKAIVINRRRGHHVRPAPMWRQEDQDQWAVQGLGVI